VPRAKTCRCCNWKLLWQGAPAVSVQRKENKCRRINLCLKMELWFSGCCVLLDGQVRGPVQVQITATADLAEPWVPSFEF
jgi:hypothetical protein